jgi:hypothetical protein
MKYTDLQKNYYMEEHQKNGICQKKSQQLGDCYGMSQYYLYY